MKTKRLPIDCDLTTAGINMALALLADQGQEAANILAPESAEQEARELAKTFKTGLVLLPEPMLNNPDSWALQGQDVTVWSNGAFASVRAA